MKEKTDKLVTLISLAIAIIGSIFAVMFALNPAKNAGMYNVAYITLLAFIGLSFVAILAFLVLRVIKGKGWGILIGIGLVAALVLISWLISSGSDLSPVFLQKHGATEGTSKLVGACCIMAYVLGGLSVISIIYVEVAKFFKK